MVRYYSLSLDLFLHINQARNKHEMSIIGQLLDVILINIVIMWLQVEGVQHSGPTKLVLYFTGATNILYTFGGHAVTV